MCRPGKPCASKLRARAGKSAGANRQPGGVYDLTELGAAPFGQSVIINSPSTPAPGSYAHTTAAPEPSGPRPSQDTAFVVQSFSQCLDVPFPESLMEALHTKQLRDAALLEAMGAANRKHLEVFRKQAAEHNIAWDAMVARVKSCLEYGTIPHPRLTMRFSDSVDGSARDEYETAYNLIKLLGDGDGQGPAPITKAGSRFIGYNSETGQLIQAGWRESPETLKLTKDLYGSEPGDDRAWRVVASKETLQAMSAMRVSEATARQVFDNPGKVTPAMLEPLEQGIPFEWAESYAKSQAA